MKILFYDVKEFENELLMSNLPKYLEAYFFKNSLSNSTYIDEKYKDIEALSCFVDSNLDKETLSKFKNLKYIFLRCVGYSNVDLNYCKENNIQVYNAKNYGNSTVAEYVFALILNLERKILFSKKAIQDGEINSSELIGSELNSKTIGIVGAGAIGRKVVNIAHGFDMKVLIFDIKPKGAYNFVELDELLERSDYIVLTCPLTEKTKGLIDEKAISKMKKNALLINVARGEIVDTKALFEALVDKKIKGAGLDVVECEEIFCKNYEICKSGIKNSDYCLKKYFFLQKLTQLKNVIITPHNAYNTKEAIARIIKITIENIEQVKGKNTSAQNLILL